MPNVNAKIEEARQRQSNQSKQATLDLLKGKTRREKTVQVQVSGQELSITFKAISSHDLDRLQSKYPPTSEQRVRGMQFNPETFAPALVAACAADPEMTEEDAREIWKSESWSTGELNFLFDTCSQLCMEGLDIPFTGKG